VEIRLLELILRSTRLVAELGTIYVLGFQELGHRS
jgi:hypothetical protein